MVEVSEMSDDIKLSAEDHFGIFDMEAEFRLFPHPFLLGSLSTAATQLEREWRFLWDFRTSEHVYADVVDAFEEADRFPVSGRSVLARPGQVDMLRSALGADVKRIEILPTRAKPLASTSFDLKPFSDGDIGLGDIVDYSELVEALDTFRREDDYLDVADDLGFVPPEAHQELETYYEELSDNLYSETLIHEEEYFRTEDLIVSQRATILEAALKGIRHHSLLSELILERHGDGFITATPYHSFSIHGVESGRPNVWVRPGRVDGQYQRTYGHELGELERIISDPDLKERELEGFLLRHPRFLEGLNYQRIYSQVVLPRIGASDLRPDIIAEPIDSDWAHIVELKR